MNFKAALLILIVGVVLMNEAESHHLKLKLLKAKFLAPHIAAKVAVAKEIKVKTGIAVAKSVAAVKATKLAALSVLTAPFRVAKKSLAIKVGAVKAVKAAKVLKLASAAAILANLKKGPIILPVPIAVPHAAYAAAYPGNWANPIGSPLIPKSVDVGLGGLAASLSGLGGLGVDASASVGPLQGLIAGAQKVLQSAGSLPILSTLTNGLSGASLNKNVYVNTAPAPAPVPVYRFVPEIGFANYNKVTYQPQVEVEVPHHVVPEVNSGIVTEFLPPNKPHSEYGPPATSYGVPNF